MKNIKLQHEQWVTETLGAKDEVLNRDRNREYDLVILNKITTGKQLRDMLDCDACRFDNDELDAENIVELIGNFFDLCHDYGKICDDLMPSDRLKFGLEMSREIEILNNEGLVLFGKKRGMKIDTKHPFENKNVSIPMNTTCLFIARQDNPYIVNDDYFVVYYPCRINFR